MAMGKVRTSRIPTESGANDVGATGCVLVVEDDHDVRVSVRNTLEDEGYRVLSVTDGRRALELLDRAGVQPPDLILLDLMLPVMDGWEFAARLRAIPRLRGIPVAVMSAFEREPPADVVEYLKKPVRAEALLALVAQYCQH